MARGRLILIGAHLHEEDAALDGVERLAVGALTLSAIAAEPDRSLADRELVARAALLRGELAAREIFVAIRYGATVADEVEARERCGIHLARWRELLTRWRGCAELTLRAGGGAASARPDRSRFRSGGDYLRALHALRSASTVDPRFVAAAESRLAAVAEKMRSGHREGGATEIAILVRRESIPRARELALGLRDEFPSIPFLLSGPWPLEVFADA